MEVEVHLTSRCPHYPQCFDKFNGTSKNNSKTKRNVEKIRKFS